MISIKERDKNCNEFLDIFHLELRHYANIDIEETQLKQKTVICLDLFKFEDKMREKWYKDDKSLQKFIKETYWDNADVLIQKLL